MVGSNDMLHSGNAVPLAEYEKSLDTLAKRSVELGGQLMLMTSQPGHIPCAPERHGRSLLGPDGPSLQD